VGEMKKKIQSFEDLDVYQNLFGLHLEIYHLTMGFPKYELYELGSQLRRSSNSIPANFAEGWNNRHLKTYLEGINRAFGELQETKHHISVAFRKNYLNTNQYENLVG
jgi:four helix bundle protein